MYMTRGHRELCVIVLIPLLLLVGLLTFLVMRETRTDTTGLKVTIVVLLLIAMAPGIPLGLYYFSEGSKKRYQPDILKDIFQITTVAELDGVQWTLLAFPDRIAAPGVAVIAFLVQNAHSTPRVMTVSLLRNPFKIGGGMTVRQRLEGGETGMIRFPLLVAPPTPPARHELEFSVEARREGSVGARVIPRDGRHPRRLAYSRRVDFEVLGAHGGATLNEGALGWSSYQRVSVTGQETPDLEPVRLLEAL